MKLKIRHLCDTDIGPFRTLMQVFAEAFEDQESYQSKPPTDLYLKKLLGQTHIIALTAHNENEVIGGLTAYELAKLEQERSEIYIFDLAVSNRHRRQGIATALIEYLRSIAIKRGASVILVQADLGDDPAISLYSKLGGREEVLHFDIPVIPLCDRQDP